MRHERVQSQCTLDATGDHQIAYSTTFAARYWAHNELARVFFRAARSLGADARFDPSSRSVLQRPTLTASLTA